MSIVLDAQIIREILYGTSFLAAGGGGPLQVGLNMLDSMTERYGDFTVELKEVEEMSQTEHAVVIAALGSPEATVGNEDKGFCVTEGKAVFNTLERIHHMAGRPLTSLIWAEHSPINGMIAINVALEKGLPILDADAAGGRAVPGFDVFLGAVHGVPISPAVFADARGNVTIVMPDDPHDCYEVERIGRLVCTANDFVVGFGTYVVSREDILTKLTTGSLSLSQKVGALFLKALEDGIDPMEDLKKILTLTELCRGEVLSSEAKVVGGQDFGLITFRGKDGNKYYIDVQNESLIFRNDEKVLITVPDSILTYDTDTLMPLSNADIKEGMNVMVCAMPAHEHWYLTPKGESCWLTRFKQLGYNGECVRYATLTC